MENSYALPQIRAALMNEAKVLQELSNQAFTIESHLKRIARRIYELENGITLADLEKTKSNIIAFPEPVQRAANQAHAKNNTQSDRPFLHEEQRKHPFLVPILAKPGEPIPVAIPDFRNSLQRNGLILLSWDKHIIEGCEYYTAYWVTSTGVCRYFASTPLCAKDFVSAQPDHKSYAADDGIEFYGQPRPYYIVHVAPELMMNNRAKIDERPKHIEKLKELGIQSDFNYKYLLTRERKKFPVKRRTNGEWEKSGA